MQKFVIVKYICSYEEFKIIMKQRIGIFSKNNYSNLKQPIVVRRIKCVHLLCAISLSFSMNSIFASEQSDNKILDEVMAVEIAVRNNPNLAEMNARFKALAQIPSQAGSLPDPLINLNAMNFPTDTFDRAQEPMTQLQVGFSQVFPFPGKLGLKEEAAEYDAQAASFNVDEVRLQLIRNVKSKWWELFYLDRALVTVEKQSRLVASIYYRC